MESARALSMAMLAAALTLPMPGTGARDRGFCGAWLDLAPGQKHDVLVAAERREQGAITGDCRAGSRAALRHKLDAECRNWNRLMDFEVRAVIDGVLEPCGEGRGR